MPSWARAGSCSKAKASCAPWAYERIPWLTAGVLAIVFVAFAVTFDYSVLAQSNLHGRSWGLAFPVLGALVLLGIVIGAWKQRDGVPFAMTVLFFLAAYLSLGVMFWPYVIPYILTAADAAAPDASLKFLFYGGIVVLPVIAVYTISVYWVFRGKVRKGYG
jgi:cytochrome d ubiquinol oxidase subunit II